MRYLLTGEQMKACDSTEIRHYGVPSIVLMERAGENHIEPISRREAMFETMMLGLRTTAGVSEAGFFKMHGVPLEAVYGKKLRRIAAAGLLSHEDGRWALNRRGMDLQNSVLVELMDEST